MPLHLATFVFDSLFNHSSKSKEQQQLKDHLTPLIEQLEQHTKNAKALGAVSVSSDFNFDKLQYRIPASFTKAPMSDRSHKKGEKDGKKGKKDRKGNDKDS